MRRPGLSVRATVGPSRLAAASTRSFPGDEAYHARPSGRTRDAASGHHEPWATAGVGGGDVGGSPRPQTHLRQLELRSLVVIADASRTWPPSARSSARKAVVRRSARRRRATRGRRDALVATGALDDLIRSPTRFSGQRRVVERVRQDGLQAHTARARGPALVFGRLWEQQGLPEILARLAQGRRVGFDLERAAFLLALQRRCAPGSDRPGAAWLRAIECPGAEALALQHLYRTVGSWPGPGRRWSASSSCGTGTCSRRRRIWCSSTPPAPSSGGPRRGPLAARVLPRPALRSAAGDHRPGRGSPRLADRPGDPAGPHRRPHRLHPPAVVTPPGPAPAASPPPRTEPTVEVLAEW